jgi:hypothetical protein
MSSIIFMILIMPVLYLLITEITTAKKAKAAREKAVAELEQKEVKEDLP